MIVLTAAACLAALVFRTPLRSRYWAWRIQSADSIEERATFLTHLCNAGNAGHWGTETLLHDSDPEIRQFGVIVLQHDQSDWSGHQLLQLLEDPDQATAEMAALGLAIHGDNSIIPRLRELYAAGDVSSAQTACLALERLATPEAVKTLALLATRPSDPAKGAAVIDALGAIGTPGCIPPLLALLTDHRPCNVPTRAEQLLNNLTPLASQHGLIEIPSSGPASKPTSEPAPRTIAERAAAALTQITGLNPPFASELPDDQRQAAERIWRQRTPTSNESPPVPPSPLPAP